MSDVPHSPGEMEVLCLEEEDKKCSLYVEFECFNIKYGDGVYPVTMTLPEWLHIGNNKDIYRHIEMSCTEHETTVNRTDTTEAVIYLRCSAVKCRSMSYRQKWSHTLQVSFNDAASQLITIRHPVRQDKVNVVFKMASESLLAMSGQASVFRSKSGIVIVTDANSKGGVELMLTKWTSWRESGYISVEGEYDRSKRESQTSRRDSGKIAPQRRKSSSVSILTLTGNKRNLLRTRPKAFEYFKQRVEGSGVSLKVDGEYQLVTTEDHYQDALKLLSSLKTKDFQMNKTTNLEKVRDELVKRNEAARDKMVVQVDTSNSLLVITATDDVFDSVLSSVDKVKGDTLQTEKCHSQKAFENKIGSSSLNPGFHSVVNTKSEISVPLTQKSESKAVVASSRRRSQLLQRSPQDRLDSDPSLATIERIDMLPKPIPQGDKKILTTVLSIGTKSETNREMFYFTKDITPDKMLDQLKSSKLSGQIHLYRDQINGKLVVIGKGDVADWCFQEIKRSLGK